MKPDTKKKIEEAAIVGVECLDCFIRGATFGHSLATEEKDAEIERLKNMPGMFHATMCIEQQIKISSIESALKVAVEALSDTRQFLHWLGYDSLHIAHQYAKASQSKMVDVDKALQSIRTMRGESV